jgi:hypothetical protein
METLVSMIAFLALVVSWFVLPSAPPQRKEVTARAVSEAMPTAA